MNKERLLKRLAKEGRRKSKGHVKNLRKRLTLAGVELPSEGVEAPPVKPKASKKKTAKKSK
jgi:hypothetical protein